MKSILLASFLFLLAEFSFAEELTNYIITSDSQINTLEGDLEAKGNVAIKSNSGNFEAYSDKLSFDKDDKSLKLIGNVFVKNLESEGIAIEETSGDELTIFTDKGLFEFKAQNKNRVTTKIKF
jgi:lipopolysaccharide export system protein LptA